MKETIVDSQRIKNILILVTVIVLLGILSFTAYYYLVLKNNTKTEESGSTTGQEKSYPAETIIEKTEDENVVKITPSKEDTLQVKDSRGDYVEVPKPTTPPPPPVN